MLETPLGIKLRQQSEQIDKLRLTLRAIIRAQCAILRHSHFTHTSIAPMMQMVAKELDQEYDSLECKPFYHEG